MTALVPRLKPARVTITLKDGRQATHACESHRGDFNDPFAESEIRDKFRELAGTVVKQEGVAGIEQAVDRIEEWTGIAELVELLRRHSRS
jgi:2-methylcitrate dehydratase PrpD